MDVFMAIYVGKSYSRISRPAIQEKRTGLRIEFGESLEK